MPVVGNLAARLRRVLEPLPPKDASAWCGRRDTALASTEAERQKWKVLNLVGYTKRSGAAYKADEYPAAYHTLELGGERIAGQRDFSSGASMPRNRT